MYGTFDRFERPCTEGSSSSGERKECQSENENSVEERRRDGTFNKKEIDASSEFKNSFSKESKKRGDNQVPLLVKAVRNSEELNAVEAFRQVLTKNDLLPAKFDDYYTMLRFLKARKFNIEQAKCMWANMLQWKRDFGTDTILEVILFGDILFCYSFDVLFSIVAWYFVSIFY